MTRRKVMVVTGIRSEYFLLEPLLEGIEASSKLELIIVATGAHLSPRYGYTLDQIKNRFNDVETILSLFDTDELIGRVKGLGLITMELAEIVRRRKPDFLLVLGDREESLAVATVGNYLNIPVVHLGGGDRVIGNVDDHVRHAVTKMAHLHCPFTVQSGRRILQMGEEKWRVTVTGSPGLDAIKSLPDLSLEELETSLGISLGAKYFVLLQHPISSEFSEGASQIDVTLQAIVKVGLPTVIIKPNSDPGTRRMIEVIDEYVRKYTFLRAYTNLPRLQFVNLLRHAVALVGNSSAGIHEAPFLHLPAVNIGNRQKEREHSNNIIFVPFDVDTIAMVLEKLAFDTEYRLQFSKCISIYGDGNAVPRIVHLLESVEIDRKLLYKDFIDLPEDNWEWGNGEPECFYNSRSGHQP
ncbi:GDP/UDP-N,N'-diacetylbacillosamine 2-epimerase (hydrolyzing) [Moorella humiferrea]|uniref:GDP/UDP-N,N'-diacetylbacillosamine 2-epimerase n=2 Tax=Neomoorella humiferrea TaxID=676965 RepID=A0A2T0AN40_9FIRM|nr:GDP/UDP-N,N'-diacetylbacillosamine 2-epimerase [Moorella humiferrea]